MDIINKLDIKEAKRKERESKRIEKERLKLEKQQTKAAKNAIKPGECIKYMIINFDKNLIESIDGSEIISKISANEIQYKIDNLCVPFSIIFYRQDAITLKKCRENEAIVVIPIKEFTSLVFSQIYGTALGETNSTLLCKCRLWKQTLGTNIMIVICGLNKYYQNQKTISQRAYRENILNKKTKKRKKSLENEEQQVSRVDVETALMTIQIEENINHRIFVNPSNLADFIVCFNKSIAEKPYKQNKQSVVEFRWYAEGSNNNCVKVDKSDVGLLKLWHQQLRQFNNVGIEVAQAIVKEYPSPILLWNAYNSLPEEKSSHLLADIPVRRGQGILANTRCIGPELSKKIYKFMTEKNPNTIL